MKKRAAIFILVSIPLLSLPALIKLNVLVLYDFQRQGIHKLYLIKPHDEFTVKWTHSVELTPWEEIFRIGEDYEVYLDRTRFQQFGAGVPDTGTNFRLEDEYMVFFDLDLKMKDGVPYGISKIAEHKLIFKGKIYDLYEQLEDGERIIFRTERMSVYKFLYNKLLT